MTTYYKGNNIGLNYDAAAGSWSFTNTPKDFIDPNAFSTPDPVFPTAPTTPTTPDPTPDPCPAGYVYDEALKQCVPDPNYQNPFRQDNNQGPREEPVILGTGRELPSKFSSGGGLFPYSTDAPTRAQQNEHMLLQSGISFGWLVDNGQGQYIKAPFNEKQVQGIGWAGAAMKYFNEKSYNDYFKILEKGWQPEGKGLWDKFLRGNSVYSLTGNMKYGLTTTGRGGTGSRTVEYYDYSPDFKKKIELAKSITNGMIDRDGNVNVNTGQGSYYREDGKFVDKYGQVSASGSLGNALKLLKQANEIGGMPSNLKARLLKGITTKALSDEERNKLAQDAGFKNAEDAITELNKVKTKITEQQKRDEPDPEPEKTVTDPSKIGDNVTTSVGGDISSNTPDANIDPSSPTYTQDNYEQASGVNQNNNNNTPVVGPNPGDAGSSTSSGSSSSGNNYPNTPPPGYTPKPRPTGPSGSFKG